MPGDDGGRSPETLVCDRCGEPFDSPRPLAVHLERHRPVLPPKVDPETRKEVSHRCPAGCGRSFEKLSEYREHAPVCDGSPPLPEFGSEDGPRPKREVRQLVCPECPQPNGFGNDHEAFAVHLERHREVLGPTFDRKGRPASDACPKACGRHFPRKKGSSRNRQLEEHLRMCDGSAPLAPTRKEAEARRLREEQERKGEMADHVCDECGKKCGGAQGLAAHKRWTHRKGAAARPSKPERDVGPGEPPSGEGAPSSDVDGLVGLLKEKAADQRRKADRLDEIAEELKSLL